MSLAIGIVGLPNVGKSTLFNALLKRQAALVANYPFATIEPNVGIVAVPDPRLEELAKVVETSTIKPATVEFIDIAGLVKGAHQGEGLGNQFLAYIREVRVICHVLRAFDDENIIREGALSPQDDLATVRTELQLADLDTLQKQLAPKANVDSWSRERWQIIEEFKRTLGEGKQLTEIIGGQPEGVTKTKYQQVSQELALLTAKPELFVINVSENQLISKSIADLTSAYSKEINQSPEKIVVMCNKIESELSSLGDADQELYLRDLGLEQSGLERLITAAYQTLGLQSFLTAGKKEVRAWTVPMGTTARKAAGVIHTDFEKKMISVNVVKFDEFVNLGGWKGAKEAGKIHSEGRDYIMQEGDVVEFLIGN